MYSPKLKFHAVLNRSLITILSVIILRLSNKTSKKNAICQTLFNICLTVAYSLLTSTAQNYHYHDKGNSSNYRANYYDCLLFMYTLKFGYFDIDWLIELEFWVYEVEELQIQISPIFLFIACLSLILVTNIGFVWLYPMNAHLLVESIKEEV
jgi:hypothetical protein